MSFTNDTIGAIREALGEDWPAAIYREKVRPQRTRAFTLGLPPRPHRTEILYTLLGIELKAGMKRIACPDLGTARYLQVFARIGCDACAVPYDITKVSPIADALETAWQTALLLADEAAREKTKAVRTRLRTELAAELRREIAEIGPGSLMPEFRQSTKQRNGG